MIQVPYDVRAYYPDTIALPMRSELFLVFLALAAPASALAPSIRPRARTPIAQGRPVVSVSRKAVLQQALGASALAFFAPMSASAADKKETAAQARTTILKLTFEQSAKLKFSQLGWGDAEVKELSKALTRQSATTKLFLDGNSIGDGGVSALAGSLRAGAAPKLKTVNLSGNAGVSEEAARKLVEAREGLTVTFEQPTAKQAAESGSPSSAKKSKLDEAALYKLAFEQAETLFYSELGWGDAEAVALSRELKSAYALKKLFLNGNAIECEGGQALAASIRAGGAPNLKILNLAGNRGLTELDRRQLTSARSGLTVNFVQLKQKSDAEVYIRADQGKLTVKGVIERTLDDTLVEGPEGTCAELTDIVNLDRATIKIEQNLLKGMKDPVEIKKIEDIERKLLNQVDKLDKILAAKKAKGCNDGKNKLAGSSGYPLRGSPRT